MRPAQLYSSCRDFLLAQRSSVRLMSSSLGRRTLGDRGLTTDERRLPARCFGCIDRSLDGLAVMPVDIPDHVPSVGLEAFRRVIREPPLHMPVNGNAIVIVKGNQLAQAERSRQRAGLV